MSEKNRRTCAFDGQETAVRQTRAPISHVEGYRDCWTLSTVDGSECNRHETRGKQTDRADSVSARGNERGGGCSELRLSQKQNKLLNFAITRAPPNVRPNVLSVFRVFVSLQRLSHFKGRDLCAPPCVICSFFSRDRHRMNVSDRHRSLEGADFTHRPSGAAGSSPCGR